MLPLDFFIDTAAQHMAPTEGALPPAGQEVIDLAAAAIDQAAPGMALQPLERFEL